MADLRLDRADAHAPVIPVRQAQRLELGGVSKRCGRRVALDELNARGIAARVLARPANGERLALRIRGAHPPATPVARGAHAAHDCVNPVAVADRIAQALQDDHRGSLAQHGAVGIGRKRTAARRRERPGLRERDERPGGDGSRRSAREHDVRATRTQRVDGNVDRGDRRPARSVDHQLQAHEIERLHQPRDADLGAMREHGFLRRRRAALDEVVVDRGGERRAFGVVGHRRTQRRRLAERPLHSQRVRTHAAVPHRVLTADRLADHDGGSRVVDAAVDQTRVPQRTRPAGQDESLLRVELPERRWWDAELDRVELRRLDDRADRPPSPIGRVRIGRSKEGGLAFEPRRRQLADRRAASGDAFPEAIRIVATREHRREADHGDRLAQARSRPPCAAVERGLVAFEHGVEVRPAEAEPRDAGPRWQLPRVGPWLRRRRDLERCLVPRDRRVSHLVIQRRRHDAVMQAEDRRHQARSARGPHQVADVRLDRAQQDRCARVAEHLEHRVDLDRIPDRRSRAVRLDVLHGVRVDARVLVRAAHRQRLGARVGSADALLASVARAPDAAHDGVHAVVVAKGVGKSLRDEQPRALADHEAVRSGVERPYALPGQAVELAEGDLHGFTDQRMQPADQRDVELAEAQRIQGALECCEGRGARRVERAGPAAQVEVARDPARRDVGEQPGQGVLGDRSERVDEGRAKLCEDAVGGLNSDAGVLETPLHGLLDECVLDAPVHRRLGVGSGAGDPQEDSRTVAVERPVVEARVGERLDGGCQREPLQPVHRAPHERRDPELSRIHGDLVDVARDPAVGPVGGARIGVVEDRSVEAVGRQLADAVPPREDVRPERRGVASEREHAADSDDRNRAFEPAELLSHRVPSHGRQGPRV